MVIGHWIYAYAWNPVPDFQGSSRKQPWAPLKQRCFGFCVRLGIPRWPLVHFVPRPCFESTHPCKVCIQKKAPKSRSCYRRSRWTRYLDKSDWHSVSGVARPDPDSGNYGTTVQAQSRCSCSDNRGLPLARTKGQSGDLVVTLDRGQPGDNIQGDD